MGNFCYSVLFYLTLFPLMSFSQLRLETVVSPVNDGLHDVYFLNDSMGWAYTYGTGIIIKTKDCGITWEICAQLDSIYFEQIQFLDQDNGWICGENGKILKTENGGFSWEDCSYKQHDGLVLFYAMHFFSSHEGFVGGMIIKNKEREYLLLKTTDGGKSWEPIKNNPQSMLYNILYIDDSTGFASGDREIFKTTNRGGDWEVIYEDTIGSVKQIRGLYFLSKKTGWACSFSGKILKTIDGGKSWDVESLTTNRLRSITFVNETLGYIVGDKNNEPTSSLYITNDSGKSWEAIGEELPDLHRITHRNNNIWAVGKEGCIINIGPD